MFEFYTQPWSAWDGLLKARVDLRGVVCTQAVLVVAVVDSYLD